MKHEHEHHSPYLRLAAMALLSFIAMYILMYAMVDRFPNIYPNLNQFYMAALMAAPMVGIELILMGNMYPNRKLNLLAWAVSTITLVAAFLLIREQTAITDKEFLKSMIPHHAGAILMCEEAPFTDPEIKQLCETIIASQQEEIAQMKAILQRLD